MKLSALYTALLLAFSLSALTSCKDDDPAPATPAAKTCRIARIKSGPTSNSPVYIAEYVYNSKGQVSRMNYLNPSNVPTGGYIAWFYNAAGKVEEITDYSASGSIQLLDTYEYNPQGQMIKSSSQYFDQSHSHTWDYTYEYNTANQVIKRTATDPSMHIYMLYEYLPNGNVSTAREYHLNKTDSTFALKRTYEYTHDDKINPFPIRPEDFMSKNNIISVQAKNPGGNVEPWYSYTSTYTYNSEGYPVELVSSTLNNKQFFEYKCQ